MTSTTLFCPSSIVQPFDQKCGSKEWIPRRTLVHIVSPLPLSTIKGKGARGRRREGHPDGCHPTWKNDYRLSATRCFITAAAESDVLLQEPIAEAEASVETRSENLDVRNFGLEAATGKDSEKQEQVLRRIPGRRVVEEKEVIVGSIFTGRVRSILSFGAFVDFGAFTDGLVHISQLSYKFVRSVEDIVSIGQEVQVKILDVNFETKRIALSMKEAEEGGQDSRPNAGGRMRGGSGQVQGGGEGGGTGIGRGKTAGSFKSSKPDEKKKSNLQKGQQIDGVVKNVLRRGAFVTLPGGEEGFLPLSEIPGGDRTPLENLVPIGKEVSVRVVKIVAGKVTLSLKPVFDLASMNEAMNQDIASGSGNAFAIAFRSNPVIGKYLTDLEAKPNQPTVAETPAAVEDAFAERGGILSVADESKASEEMAVVAASVNSLAENLSKKENAVIVDDESEKVQGNEEAAKEGEHELLSVTNKNSTIEIAEAAEIITPAENAVAVSTGEVVATEDKIEEASGKSVVDGEGSIEKEHEMFPVVEETTAATEDTTIPSGPNLTSTEKTEEIHKSTDDKSGELIVEKADSKHSIEEANEEAVVHSTAVLKTQEGTELLESNSAAAAFIPNGNSAFPEAREAQFVVPPEGVEQLPSLILGAKENSVQSTVPVPEEGPSMAPRSSSAITSTLVRTLREETGAGMMDCKKALVETGGSLEEARDYLRKKGLANAEKKAGRIAAEGLIGSYIHDSRIGVLIEVNCETDFVSRGEIFKQIVEDLAMQVVANQQVQYVSVEDVPLEIKNKEIEIELQREDLQNKPEKIRAKIVEGRVNKRLGELALLEQPFIKDDSILVKDVVQQTIAGIGENIQVRRFTRFTLGEGLERKVQDFATEVAAQSKTVVSTGPVEGSSIKQPIEKDASPSAPTHVSATVVKQLREESGAGMMDCKKALVASSGDLEGAREYLRKKGLASADKKSSRIAAEGAIGSYIHDSRIGALIEVNCETDFVSRGEIFKQLIEDLAMQVAANQQVEYVSVEDIPRELQAKEREIEMQRDDLQKKPEQFRAKILDGRLAKRFGELSLLEQPFIKNDNLLVKDLVKQTIANLGENVRVRRFARYTLGEGLAKRSEDFAAEVAAQTRAADVIAK